MRPYIKIQITPKAERSLRGGHPWVYADEVVAASAPYENGTLVDVVSERGRYLGTGFINDHSKIRVRLISRNANDRFDAAFYERRLRHAVSYRQTVLGGDLSSCRLIFGEADLFPGLTVDKFEDILVTETLSLGMERLRSLLFPQLVRILSECGFPVRALYERGDNALRQREGMPCHSGYFTEGGLADLSGEDGCVQITENGIRYTVDYREGQKTGFFLDQRFNRQAVARLARGRTVLDCFTHTGSFGLNCAAAGAQRVTSVDISANAIATARRNAEQNGLADRIEYVTADVFDYLTACKAAGGAPYDLIILDPPAFTKSRDTLKNAIRGYKEINLKAMQLLPRGGYLATCSCSHFMTDTYFKQMLHNAAEDAGVSLRQIEARTQGPDHPILWNVPETDYLKFYIFQVF